MVNINQITSEGTTTAGTGGMPGTPGMPGTGGILGIPSGRYPYYYKY
ncbi:hypothetical protein [uncultured Metabacillus sp.]|nr:hypothetical protein [uncultured Metabacillus sp.]